MQIITFIGLGNMGMPMALQLLKAGYQVRGVEVCPEKRELFVAEGGEAYEQVPEASLGAHLVITMLPRDEYVESAIVGAEGVIHTLQENTLIIDMSTISPETSLRVNKCLEAANLRFIDAPVGRTPADAAKGSLLVMAGGKDQDIQEAMPVFNCLADKIIHLGPVGSGVTMKVINNYMSMVSMVMTAEVLTMASKAGISEQVAVEVLQNTVAGKGQINTNYPKKVLAGDITPDFPIELGLKDLSLALKLAHKLHSPVFLGASSAELFNLAISQGRAQQDCTAMFLALQELAGVENIPSMK